MLVQPRRKGLVEVRFDTWEEFEGIDSSIGGCLKPYTEFVRSEIGDPSIALARLDTESSAFHALEERLMALRASDRPEFFIAELFPYFSDEEHRTATEYVMFHRNWMLSAPWEYGSEYYLAEKCPLCGAGCFVMPPVYLGGIRRALSTRIVHCPNGEWLVDSTIARDMLDAKIRGALLSPVIIRRTHTFTPERLAVAEHAGAVLTEVYTRRAKSSLSHRDTMPPPDYLKSLNSLEDIRNPPSDRKYWYMLHSLNYPFDLKERVILGFDFFDVTGGGASGCPRYQKGQSGYHLAGYRHISDFASASSILQGMDFGVSIQHVGVFLPPDERREGVFTAPYTIASQRFVDILRKYKLIGLELEPVRTI